MTTYVHRNGRWVDKKTGEPMQVDMSGPVQCPRYIIPDIEPHKGPDGKMIRSRSDLADLRARTGYVPHERVGEALDLPKRSYSERDDHWAEWKHTTREKVAKRAGLDAESLQTEMAARKAFGSLRDRVAAKERAKASV